LTPGPREDDNGRVTMNRQLRSGGANYGLADGSVRFPSTLMAPSVFVLAGSMADGVAIKLPP
jgi:prepilin-type processing-associated H-X9-DG protein